MGVTAPVAPVRVRPSRGGDLPAVEALSRRVYPHDHPWTVPYLQAHRDRFPEGQLVAVGEDDVVVGMAASLRLPPALEEADAPYPIVTGDFRFTCHDPEGRVLYAAEVMVDPRARRQGIGGRIYAARRTLAEALGVDAIRAAARLPGYGAHRHELDLERYVREVEAGRLHDATLSFQLEQGFQVVKPLGRYFPGRDPESLGSAVLIEWRPDIQEGVGWVEPAGVVGTPDAPPAPPSSAADREGDAGGTPAVKAADAFEPVTVSRRAGEAPCR